MSDSSRVLVGVVGAPHGVRGALRVKSFTGDPAAITRYGPLATHDGCRTLEVVSFRRLKDDMAVVEFKGVADRSAAEALTNQKLYVDRARLPAPEEDEFYHADLVGLRVQSAGGADLGRVIGLQNFGAGDLLEIAPARGETLLVPFTKVFVPEVDVRNGRVVVDDAALSGDDDADAGPAADL